LKPLTDNNIESELSYAYLHAVASYCGAAVSEANRHEDNAGVDAKITAWGPFENGGYIQEVDLKVQLKATIKQPTIANGQLSYQLVGIDRYNDLRAETTATPRILVVLFLPDKKEDWLKASADSLALRRCAYWVSLRGASETQNKTSVTVYLPEVQTFHPEALGQLLSQLSNRNYPTYGGAANESNPSN
jgi:hypothetical protein